jgi:hypothetical protein
MNEMNYTQAPATQTGLRFGLIGGLILVVIQMIVYLSGLDTTANFGLGLLVSALNIVIYIVIVRSAILTHRNQKQEGFIKFGKAFGVGFLTCLIMGLITGIVSIIYLNIDPGYLEQMLENVRAGYEDQGMSEEQIEQAMGVVGMMQNPFVIGMISLVGTLFWGTIVSLIAAAILKKEPEV